MKFETRVQSHTWQCKAPSRNPD